MLQVLIGPMVGAGCQLVGASTWGKKLQHAAAILVPFALTHLAMSYRRRAGLVLGGALERGVDPRRHDHTVVGARDVGVEDRRIEGTAGDGHSQLERLRLTGGDADPRPVEGRAVHERVRVAGREPGEGLGRHVFGVPGQVGHEREAAHRRGAGVGDLRGIIGRECN